MPYADPERRKAYWREYREKNWDTLRPKRRKYNWDNRQELKLCRNLGISIHEARRLCQTSRS